MSTSDEHSVWISELLSLPQMLSTATIQNKLILPTSVHDPTDLTKGQGWKVEEFLVKKKKVA